MGKARGGFWGTALHCIPAVALLLSGCAAGPGVVDFSPDRTTGPAPLAVAFTSAVSGAASAYAWNFGDGGVSSDANPVHIYTQEGVYTVTLAVETSAGPKSVRKADLIKVIAGGSGEEYLFWIERGSGKIQRAPLGGGTPLTIVHGLIGPEDLCVSGGRLYWTDPGAGTVESADIDGGSRRVIAASLNYPTGIAVDPTQGRIYWTTLPSAADADPQVQGKLTRAQLDGTGQETLVEFRPDEAFAWQLALDAASGRLYWIELDWESIGASARACRARIVRANRSGGARTDVTSSLCEPTDLAVGISGAASGLIYWTDEAAETLSQMSSDGTAQAVLASGQFEAESVAVSARTGKIYWTAGDSLSRANLDGSNVEVVYAGLDLPEGVAVGG